MKSYLYILLTFSVSIGTASAMIIRHDVDDEKYLALGKKHAPSVVYIHGCAGTLVADDWVLTAAHCVHQRENKLFFCTHLDQDYRIEKIVMHPEYVIAKDGRHDIALIELTKKVENGKPSKLYELDNESGKSVIFVGNGTFGNGRDGPTEYDKKQRGATNTIIGTNEHWIEFVFDSPDDATELEGISGGGDSGGPAFVAVESELYVAGVSSHQNGNGNKKGTYGVKEYYTRVSSYAEWIQSTINTTKVATAIPSHPIIEAIKADNATALSSALTDDVISDRKIMSEAFFQSVILDRVSMGEEMIKQGADLRSVEVNGNSLFELAFVAERENYLKMLIFTFRNMKNIHSENSEILPLVVSALANRSDVLELVSILLDQGANINIQTAEGDTAVILAGWISNNLDLVALLVERGADVNIPNENGDTPLIDAASKSKNEILEYLLNNGADVNAKNNAGHSALDLAQDSKSSVAIEMILGKEKSR